MKRRSLLMSAIFTLFFLGVSCEYFTKEKPKEKALDFPEITLEKDKKTSEIDKLYNEDLKGKTQEPTIVVKKDKTPKPKSWYSDSEKPKKAAKKPKPKKKVVKKGEPRENDLDLEGLDIFDGKEAPEVIAPKVEVPKKEVEDLKALGLGEINIDDLLEEPSQATGGLEVAKAEDFGVAQNYCENAGDDLAQVFSITPEAETLGVKLEIRASKKFKSKMKVYRLKNPIRLALDLKKVCFLNVSPQIGIDQNDLIEKIETAQYIPSASSGKDYLGRIWIYLKRKAKFKYNQEGDKITVYMR